MRRNLYIAGCVGELLERICFGDEFSSYQIIIMEDDDSRVDSLNKNLPENIIFTSFKDGKKLILDSKDQVDIYINVSSTPKRRYNCKIFFNSTKSNFPSVRENNSVISRMSSFSKGCYLGNLVTIESNSNIGEFCVLHSKSHIGHDTSLGNFCILGASVVVNSGCIIDDYCLLGSSVTLANGVKIGKGSLIQAGSFVKNDIPEYTFASGNPCNVVAPVQLLGKDYVF